ncbi:MAG TPA: twin-arginine translocation signal domain-containing protein, partial [Actinomycetota bacterium]|nr:twin-arginine translocation signal domain-containing protein [Actinomycetota bacterium]
MTTSRRDFLKGAAAAGAMLLTRPLGALSSPLGPSPAFATERASRLFGGRWLAHADLHNHTLLSDGSGNASLAFDSMRAAGLDVAALTDHSTLSWGMPQSVCNGQKDCQGLAGINEGSWELTRVLADQANVDGSFVAIRGFEWSSPTLGHINVWGSERWMDPLHTGGAGTGEGAAQFAHDEADLPAEQMAALDAIVKASPAQGAGMALFYDWLLAQPAHPGLGGGADGLAGFNHPGREPGRFTNFRLDPRMRGRMSSLEVFNRNEDYLFEGTDSIAISPINECLNAGWRVGLLGVTDEHGTNWGYPDGKGRAGLWVTSLTRHGVAEAIRARRFFSTRLRGLRLDASANGHPMGAEFAHTSGPITFRLDIDRGAAWTGTALKVSVLRSGATMPAIQHVADVVVPGPADPVIEFTVDVDRADGDW